ncbi:MAG: polyprenyl synthetase family protein [Anaerolineaceae bacterium]|nr:polyprenyl synthetase family protein [Anaerolineaceae bacterium]
MPVLRELQQELLPVIEGHLRTFLSGMDYGQSAELGDMLTYHMGWDTTDPENAAGGKRIRLLLTLLCHGAFTSDLEPAIPAAIAVELLHNFTLIHDDVQDNSPLRHNRPTLWKKWGLAQAINAGDALFSIAQTAMLSLEKTCGTEIALQATKQLNAVCLHLTRGQYLDIAFETAPDVTVETYLDMVEGKTAALIAFAASLGGLTAKQELPIRDRLSDFGNRLGLAFQIQDDLLGIWGDPEVTGKSAASDLLTHKKSLPVLFGLENSPEFFSVWSNEPLTESDVQALAALLEACGARDYVTRTANQYTDQAFQALDELFPRQNRYSNALYELTGQLLNRSA